MYFQSIKVQTKYFNLLILKKERGKKLWDYQTIQINQKHIK